MIFEIADLSLRTGKGRQGVLLRDAKQFGRGFFPAVFPIAMADPADSSEPMGAVPDDPFEGDVVLGHQTMLDMKEDDAGTVGKHFGGEPNRLEYFEIRVARQADTF